MKMFDATQLYRVCSPIERHVTYRAIARFPKYSASEAYFEMSDELGQGFVYFAEIWAGEPPEMVDVVIESNAVIPDSTINITLKVHIPQDALSEAGGVEFFIDGVLLRHNSYIAGFPSACYLSPNAGPISSANFNYQDRYCMILSARIIASLYLDGVDARRAIESIASPAATITIVPRSAVAGEGCALLYDLGNAIVWIIGTTNNSQLVTQAAQFSFGPINYGGYSTIPLWELGAIVTHAVLNIAAIPPAVPITLCGHSMGGAIACVLASKYKTARPNRRISLQTFGMPRPGDIRMLQLLSECNQYHVQNTGDIIPLTAPTAGEMGWIVTLFAFSWVENYEKFHSMRGRSSLSEEGQLIEGGPIFPLLEQLAAIVQAWALGLPQPNFGIHSIDVYLERLKKDWTIP